MVETALIVCAFEFIGRAAELDGHSSALWAGITLGRDGGERMAKQRRRKPWYQRAEEERARTAAAAAAARTASRGTPVNPEALAPHNSYGEPGFVTRGFYTDRPFECIDCGKAEVWTAAQQKWWYEVAKGDVFTTARRCRACRRRERERRAEARRVHLEGLARKRGRHA
jgi:hypothetical protein